jgi:HK97 family phage major capsid protein
MTGATSYKDVLLREREAALRAARAIVEDKVPFTPIASQTCAGLIEEIEKIDWRLNMHARLANYTAENDADSHNSRQERVLAKRAFAKALRSGDNYLTAEERALVSANHPNNRDRIRNVSEGVPAQGGYLIPTILMPQLIKRMKWCGGMAAAAKTTITAGGAPMAFATMDDTAVAAQLLPENTSVGTNDFVFGQTSIATYKFSSGIIQASFEVLQDSAVDLEEEILDAFALRFMRGQNGYFTTGTGSGQPQGVLTGAQIGYTMPIGNTASISYSGLVNLFQSVDPAYRMLPSCAFMMNDQTFEAVKMLVDSAGRPLWLPTTGPMWEDDITFDTLLGKRLIINNDMPSMAAKATPIAFGDFSRYRIRQVQDVTFLRMTDSYYTHQGVVGFLAFARAGGALLDPNAIKTLANSAT